MTQIVRANAPGSETETLVALIREEAKNLYLSRKMLCAEAVVVTLNQVMDGGLSREQAIAMASPFSVAMGGSGCLCGALTGAVMGSGLILGNQGRESRENARQLHDTFKTAHGATCCRILTRKVTHDPKAHFRHCSEMTAQAADMSARLILSRRPDLIRPGLIRSDLADLPRENWKFTASLVRLFQVFSWNR